MNFSTKIPLSTGLWVATFCTLIAALCIALFVKPMDSKTELQKLKMSKNNLLIKASDTNKKIADMQTALAVHDWKEDSTLIATESMSILSQIGSACQVQVTSFRPQKSEMIGGQVVTPLAVVVQGKFMDITKFLSEVEAEKKLSVDGVQVSTTNTGQNLSQANLNLLTFVSSDYSQTPPLAVKGGKSG